MMLQPVTLQTGKKGWFNPTAVELVRPAYAADSKEVAHTVIHFLSGMALVVQETPEAILALIEGL